MKLGVVMDWSSISKSDGSIWLVSEKGYCSVGSVEFTLAVRLYVIGLSPRI